MKIFSKNLKHTMQMNGVSQYRLAKELGVTHSTVWAYTNGDAVPRLEKFAKLCSVLGVSADSLLYK